MHRLFCSDELGLTKEKGRHELKKRHFSDSKLSKLVGILYRMECGLCFSQIEHNFVKRMVRRNTVEYDIVYDKYIKRLDI